MAHFEVLSPKKSAKPKSESVTPFLKEAQAGDEHSTYLLRLALSNGIKKQDDVKPIGSQAKAQLLKDLHGDDAVDEETRPLTEEELEFQKRMGKFLPKIERYRRRKPIK